MVMRKIILYTVTALQLLTGILYAQQTDKKAWELSLGANALGLSRLNISNASKHSNHYLISADRKEALFGVNLSVSREIGKNWALELNQSFSYTSEVTALTNIGVQHRLGSYFRKYPSIDPFVTVGLGYMYNGLSKPLQKVTIEGKEIDYKISNRSDKKLLLPLYAGGGVLMWLNNKWGLHLEGGYQVLQHMKAPGLWYLRAGVRLRIGKTEKCPCSPSIR